MKKMCVFVTFCWLAVFSEAREWTSSDGKTIEADLVRSTDDEVVLMMNGKEFTIPLSRLSQSDRDFVKEASAAAAVTKMTLFGQKLEVGQVNNFEIDLSEDAQKDLSDNKLAPSKIKIQLLLPPGFDPDQEQMVFWPVGGINNENERLKGNLGRFRAMSQEALKAGYVVIAADTEHGNPRETTIGIQEGDHAFHSDLIERVSAEWPQFKTWKHACGGNSSGAKGSFFRVAQLLANDVNVVGGFFAGCNGCYAEQAFDESGARKSALKPVKAWVSTGMQDKLVSREYNAKVVGQMESSGYRTIRNEFFEGGHGMSTAEFAKALAWFKE